MFLVTPEPERNATNLPARSIELTSLDGAESMCSGVQAAESQLLSPETETKYVPMQQTMIGKLKTIFAKPGFRYLCAAGAFRFMGGYSIGFLSASFFVNRYPDYVK